MIYVHTLSFNLPSETAEATRLLYELNPDNNFKHLIVDLGFPLEYGADIPSNIEEAKFNNSIKLMKIAKEFGSDYIKVENIGVSQNWNQIIEHLQITEDDVLICADPDERPSNSGWVKAIADVLTNSPKIAACALVMPEQREWINAIPSVATKARIHGHEVFLINGTLSMAQVGFSGRYLVKNGIPIPEGYGIYGHIEGAFTKSLRNTGMGWAILQNYYCEHTECSTLYREWKTQITSGDYKAEKQISFESWLEKKEA